MWGAVSTPRERRVYNGAPWSCGRAKESLRQCEQRGPREEKSRRQWWRRWRPAAPGTTLYMHSTTLYFTKTHAPRAVRPYHHHHQTRHTRRLLILTGMRLCEAFPRELRYGQRLCRSQCAPAADRPHTACRTAPPPSRPTLCFTRAPHGRGRTDSKSGAHRPARRR